MDVGNAQAPRRLLHSGIAAARCLRVGPVAGAGAAFVTALALGATGLALPSGAAANEGAPTLPAATPYGLVAFSQNFVAGETLEERTDSYRRLYRAGVRAIRLEINWQVSEPKGAPLHDYDFSWRDREVKAIRRAGLDVIGLLAYGHPDYSVLGGVEDETPVAPGIPPFYNLRSEYFPPDDPMDFAGFARAAASYFGNEVIGWEIWNEQNGGWRFWPPHEDPAAYAELLCAAHQELKEVDRRTPVVFGGLFFPGVPPGIPGMSASQFVAAAYNHEPELGRCYDAMAYHPYAYPFTAPEVEVPIRGSVLSAADQMRAVLKQHGDEDKPLWITEIGWPTHDVTYGVPEHKQAQYVARMQAASFAQGVPVLTWYTYGDFDDPSGGASQEAWFGFFRTDGSPKPAFRALRTFHRHFRRSRFARDRSAELGLPEGELLSGGRGFALGFRRRDPNGRRTRITALWLACESALDGQNAAGSDCSAPTSRTVALPVDGRGAKVFGFLGEGRFVEASSGRIHLEIGPDPLYVLDTRRP